MADRFGGKEQSTPTSEARHNVSGSCSGGGMDASKAARVAFADVCNALASPNPKPF
jgi:hypothetical protein